MAWIAKERRTEVIERRSEPYLTDELKKHLSDRYIPRYPTRRAVTLPALHLVQHEYGWIPAQALEEIAAFLELAPAEVYDTASFYEEYWLKPKGQYLVQVCRSLSCEICGSCDLTRRVQDKLGIEVGETTEDGRFTLVAAAREDERRTGEDGRQEEGAGRRRDTDHRRTADRRQTQNDTSDGAAGSNAPDAAMRVLYSRSPGPGGSGSIAQR